MRTVGMNNRSDPRGKNDSDHSQRPKIEQQKRSEFFEKLVQFEQK